MKNIYNFYCSTSILVLMTCLYSTASGQVTSIINGNWTMPTTWDCTCIPLPTDNIIVAHDVMLNMDYGITTGSITVNAGASLIEDVTGRAFGMSGGTFTNNGNVDITYFALSGGSLINNNSLVGHAFLSNANATNNAVMTYDSLSNIASGVFNNGSSAQLNATYLTDIGQLTNAGTITGLDFLASGNCTNTGNIILNDDFANTGIFNNDGNIDVVADFANLGDFFNNANGTLVIGVDFYNNDSLVATAVFDNNGRLEVGVDFLNEDSITGTGSICVGEWTGNNGVMSGTFDFCDKTPPGFPPYIDVNTGTIDPNITWCNVACAISIRDEKEEKNVIKAFPNPFSESTEIFFNSSYSNARIAIYDLSGRKIKVDAKMTDHSVTIDRGALSKGMYFFVLKTEGGIIGTGKLIAR